jgi:hypothetical protein
VVEQPVILQARAFKTDGAHGQLLIWVTHMKTTIDIADPILRRAKLVAARRQTTLKNVIEEALRRTFEEESRARRPQRLQTHVYRGNGLQPGLSWDDWNALRSLAYEDHGG